jgi:hypothetical protein
LCGTRRNRPDSRRHPCRRYVPVVEATGKLDAATRDGLKKYQEAEGLKVTGTLNAVTLQKMNVALTDKQKEWVAAHSQTGQ